MFLVATATIFISCNRAKNAGNDEFPTTTNADPGGKSEKSDTITPPAQGEVLFCIIVNGQHMPALAIDKGYTDTHILSNNLGGYNWFFASGTPETANVGRLQDGRIFIKKAFLEQYANGSPQLKSAANRWQPQIAKAETVGGQAAFTWK